MSWAEVKKINSDLSVPVDRLIVVNDIANYGKNGFLSSERQFKDILFKYPQSLKEHKLAFNIALNEGLRTVWDELFSSLNAGAKMNYLFDLNNSLFDTIGAFENILDNPTTRDIILNNNNVLLAIAQSDYALDRLSERPTIIVDFLDKPTFHNKFLSDLSILDYMFTKITFKSAMWDSNVILPKLLTDANLKTFISGKSREMPLNTSLNTAYKDMLSKKSIITQISSGYNYLPFTINLAYIKNGTEFSISYSSRDTWVDIWEGFSNPLKFKASRASTSGSTWATVKIVDME